MLGTCAEVSEARGFAASLRGASVLLQTLHLVSAKRRQPRYGSARESGLQHCHNLHELAEKNESQKVLA